MEHGLFRCAPVHPSLAVDIWVLNFVQSLWLRVSPNYTAWTEAWLEFLEGQGYKMSGKVQ